ncbi:MAG: universal stress protein, partial [Sphingomonadales bacterium]
TPVSRHTRIILSVDLSSLALHAAQTMQALRLNRDGDVAALYLFAVPEVSLMTHTAMSDKDIERHVMEEETHADGELVTFLTMAKLDGVRRIVRPLLSESPASHIMATARELAADLIVIGTRGRGGVARLLLGSVAEEVLRTADRDVLAVPPSTD